MKKTLLCLKLDMMTVKPYFTLKNLLLLLIVILILVFSTQGDGAAFGVAIMYSIIFASYPFALEEKNHLDLLYATLFVSRRHIVAGRYVFALCLNLLAASLAYVLNFVVSRAFGREFDAVMTLAVMVGCLLAFLCIEAVQLPLYFKLGYQKSKIMVYLPLAIFLVVSMGISQLGKMQGAFMDMITWITENLALSCVLVSVICLLLFAFSCALSCRLYQKRSF